MNAQRTSTGLIHRWRPPIGTSKEPNGFFAKVRDFLRRNGDTDSATLNRHFRRRPQQMTNVLHPMLKRGQVEVVGSVIVRGARGRSVRANVWRIK